MSQNQVELFKPNSKSTGSLVSFKVSQDKKNGKAIMWINAVRQSGWNPATKTGSFSGNAKDEANKINLKFSEFELSGIAKALDTKCSASPDQTLSFFHKNQAGVTTSIKLTYSEKEFKGKLMKGFYLSLSRGGSDNFGIGIGLENDAPRLSNYIRNIVGVIDEINYKEELRKFSGGGSSTPAPTTTKAQEKKPKADELEESPF